MARVAAGGFDDRAPGLQQALAFRSLDHADADAVLHRSAGVEHLQLREDGGPYASRDAIQPHQRGVAHGVEERVEHLHATPFVGE